MKFIFSCIVLLIVLGVFWLPFFFGGTNSKPIFNKQSAVDGNAAFEGIHDFSDCKWTDDRFVWIPLKDNDGFPCSDMPRAHSVLGDFYEQFSDLKIIDREFLYATGGATISVRICGISIEYERKHETPK